LKVLYLCFAFIGATAGFAWLALAMEVHWGQVCKDVPVSRVRTRALRTAGALGLLLSLGACLMADHASMAALVWVMLLAVAALSVAFILSWRPRLLTFLLPWIRRTTPG
jgi:hypothetical protein